MANEATPLEQAMADAADPDWPYAEGKTLSSIVNTMTAEQHRAHETLVKRTQRLCREQAQRFFEQLADSVRTPHVGDAYRDTIKSILLRATEAGLYQEPK